MSYLMGLLATLSPVQAALIGVTLATAGWLYTARRARNLHRKTHTFSALQQLSFDSRFHQEFAKMRPHIREGKLPDFADPKNEDLKEAFVFVLNHYEFIAAGVRNGDISERLLRDSERGTVVRMFEISLPLISSIRQVRKRRAVFEHLEWLYVRWEEKPPNVWQRIVECVLARPLYFERSQWIILAVVATVLASLTIGYLHLPGEPFNPAPVTSMPETPTATSPP